MNELQAKLLYSAAVILCFTCASAASAAEIRFRNACAFTETKPGMLGKTSLDYRVQPGTIFRQQEKAGVAAFCGPIELHMPPLGWGPIEECVLLNNGAIASIKPNFTIENSTCSVENPFQTTYRATEFDAWQLQGIAVLRGQAFLKTVGGDVKTCAGEFVYLIPAAPYFDQFLTVNASELANADAEAVAQLRRTVCDAQGNFSFSGLPPAKWYVLTSVTWGIPNIAAVRAGATDTACVGKIGARLGCAAVHGLLGALIGLNPPPATIEQGGYVLQLIDVKPGENQIWLTDRDRS